MVMAPSLTPTQLKLKKNLSPVLQMQPAGVKLIPLGMMISIGCSKFAPVRVVSHHGKARGMQAKMNIAALLGLELNSVRRFKETIG
jgi:hypothetical protein